MKRPNNINDAQWQAVIDASEHLLITAGPGTGKTHTLTHRICHFLSKIKSNERMLAITFTNKASGEMRERLQGFLLENLRSVDVSTFHAFCLSCLREFAASTNLPPDFQIASGLDTQAVAKEIWSEIPAQKRHQRLQEISRYKSLTLKEAPAHLPVYNQELRKRNLLDFDDILFAAFCLFRDEQNVLKALQSRYRYIFVDEYQDINCVQHEILKLLVQNGIGLTAIGDPNQAIYGFRGSDVHFFYDFRNDFPPAADRSLCENYRSSGNLLEAARQVITPGQTFDVPSLIACMHAQGRLVIYQAQSEHAEARYIVREIEKCVGGTSMLSKDSHSKNVETQGHVSFCDIAILFRTNAQRAVLEEALCQSGIPFYMAGDKPLCEEKEVVEILPDLMEIRGEPIDKALDYLAQLSEKQNNALEQLIALAKESKTTSDFLDRLFLQRENEPCSYRVEKVSLLTLHAAKGLEFPVVFMAGCEDGLLPLKREGKDVDINEERRLFYVGMTRAKRALYLTWAAKRMCYGKAAPRAVSAFVLDIEEKLKEHEKTFVGKKKQKDSQLNLFKGF